MANEAIKAGEELKKYKIDAEIIDIRTVKPIDLPIIINSIKKTGKLIIAEAAWLTGGVAGEISALVADKGFKYLKKPIKRVCLPDSPAPTSAPLEKKYYTTYKDIIKKVKQLLK